MKIAYNLWRNLLLIAPSLFLFSCKSDIEPIAEDIRPVGFKITDSIPLFNDSIAFRYVNVDKIKNDSLLAFDYPLLRLCLLSGKGDFTRELNRKGDGLLQFKDIFIEPVWDEQGNLYVLEQGYASRLDFFDPSLNLVKSVPLLAQAEDYSFPPIQSAASIRHSGNSVVVLSNIVSNLFGYHEKALYENAGSVARIEVRDYAVVNTEIKLPYADYESVQTALRENKRHWDSPIAYFKLWKDKIYVKYEFDDNVYVFDNNFNPVETITLHPAYPGRKFSIPFDKVSDTNERLADDFKLRYSRPYYYSLDVRDDRIFVLYTRPLPEERIPRTPPEEEAVAVTPVLHVFNLNDREEYSADLPQVIGPYSRVFAAGANEIYLIGNTKLYEDVNLYACRLNLESE